jgi:5-formyltetrahydrofolate cyclo-ligase
MAGDRSDDIRDQKSALREEMKARRAAIAPDMIAAAGRAVAWHVLDALPWRERPRISVFWPLGHEIDTRPILHCLHWLGGRPLLPRMQGRDRPLAFHYWVPDLPLAPGPLGVLEPLPDTTAAVPEIILTPLLAFDREGGRLGYGAGYYDRTFEALATSGHQVLRCGIGLEQQEVPLVPVGPADARLDMVVTEAGPRRFPY